MVENYLYVGLNYILCRQTVVLKQYGRNLTEHVIQETTCLFMKKKKKNGYRNRKSKVNGKLICKMNSDDKNKVRAHFGQNISHLKLRHFRSFTND